IIFFIVSKSILKPNYESDTSLLIANATDSSMNKTYASLSKSNMFASKIIEKLDLNMTNEELAGKLSVEADDSTKMINIKVTDAIPERAADIANQAALELKESIEKFNRNDALISDKANIPKAPISPDTKKNVVLGMFLGLVLSGLYVLFIFLTDSRIKNAEEIEKIYGIPLIGIIPEELKGE
ncbi:MAG: hypothetical protein E6041_20580, partial [Escherichia coli]|nr:hypothetical protein [Escherichia coli]